MTEQNRINVFLGYTKSNQEVALALVDVLHGRTIDSDSSSLKRAISIETWEDGLMENLNVPLRSLVRKLPSFDFAILLLSQDDILMSASASEIVPRDNVIFEAGLAIGLLGVDRTFLVVESHERRKLKLPTDIGSCQLVTWERIDDQRELRVDIRVAATRLQKEMREKLLQTEVPVSVPPQLENLVLDARKAMRGVRNALRSYYVGPYAQSFARVIRELKPHLSSISILCDFVTYGWFSLHTESAEYKASLVRHCSTPGTAVEIITPNEAHRRKLCDLQFGWDGKASISKWSERAQRPEFAMLLREAELRESVKPGAFDDYENFRENLESREKHARAEPSLGGKVHEIPEIPCVYIWLINRRRAVFTTPVMGENAMEQGFFTVDDGVVRTLESIVDYYRKRSSISAIDVDKRSARRSRKPGAK